MPVRSSTSSVLVWPDPERVDRAAREWARREALQHPELVRLGYFGSYASGNWGVSSDLDLVAVVRTSAQPFERRALSWNLSPLPVPAEILVYTEDEWSRLQGEGGRLARVFSDETVWLLGP